MARNINEGKKDIDFTLENAKIEQMTLNHFFDNYLRLYSAHSNRRGIPFIGDGFKEAQRKAMWGMLERGENAGKDTVERVGSYCAAVTDYHHGVGSMQGTIVGLAQDFAGSNNMNLLVPSGQFGSRLSHGASAPRYIKTMLHENFRKLFKKDDDIILQRRLVGDVKIEPHYFIPLLPMALVNGAEGMGTGHATHIFSYSPTELRDTITQVLAGKKLTDGTLVPKWKGFKGTVRRDPTTGQVIVRGVFAIENSTTIRITELPVGVQDDAYKKHLWKLEEKELIKSHDDASDDQGFDFVVTVPRTTSYRDEAELVKIFSLESRDTENFTLWGIDGKITKYRSAEHVVEEFVKWRLERYEERRQALINETQEQINWLNELIRFIKFYLENAEKFRNMNKAGIMKILTDEKFSDPDRLMSQAIWSLTKDRIDELTKKLKAEEDKLAKLLKDTPVKMYQRELNELKLDF